MSSGLMESASEYCCPEVVHRCLLGLVSCRQGLSSALMQPLSTLQAVCGDAQQRLESMQYANPGIDLVVPPSAAI